MKKYWNTIDRMKLRKRAQRRNAIMAGIFAASTTTAICTDLMPLSIAAACVAVLFGCLLAIIIRDNRSDYLADIDSKTRSLKFAAKYNKRVRQRPEVEAHHLRLIHGAAYRMKHNYFAAFSY